MADRSDFATYVDARWPDLVGGLEDEGVPGDRARLTVAEVLLGADPDRVHTNMVVLDDVDAATVVPAARAQGVLVGHVSARRIRLVTHLDVDRAGVERAAKVLGELIAR